MARLPEDVRNLRKIYLGQGEIVVTDEPIVVQTTLGSCVSVALRDPLTGLSGICHAVMPSAPDEDAPLRYVDGAVSALIERFAEEKVPMTRLSAKVFGGACSRRIDASSKELAPVGPRNVETAIECLQQAGLLLAGQDTGGSHGRRVLFVTSTGDVFVRSIRNVPIGGGR